MNVKLRRLLLPLLRHDAAGRPPTFRTRSAARQAIYLIEKPVSLKSKAAKVRQRSEKQSSRASHNQETAKIREEVFARAHDQCELCALAPPTELHHLEGGSGRRALQAVSNCIAICRDCHHFFHNAPETYREVILEWAGVYGYPVPRRFRGEPTVIRALPAKAGGAP